MLKRLFFLTFFLFVHTLLTAQRVTITGEVYDEYLEPFSGAIIKTFDNSASTVTDINGAFTIRTTLPTKIIVSYIDYASEIIEVTDESQLVSCILKENTNLDQLIVSASRLPERLFESPVSIERLSHNEITKTPSVTFYESLDNLKHVDVKTNSILLKSVNTRGFSTLENNRFVQLIDGADNVFPISNLSPGNLIGLVDSDVKDVEVLTGASSALYGANAFNGVLLINSKSPFDYGGVSVNLQSGVTVQDAGTNPFYNPSVRAGYKFSDYFAAKVAFGIYSGEEWHADDYRNQTPLGNEVKINSENEQGNSYYNGVNIYGDEDILNLKSVPFTRYLGAVEFANNFIENESDRQDFLRESEGILRLIRNIPNINISRDGYKESDLVDNRANSRKFNIAFHYRPHGNEKLEISWSSRFNTVKSIMQVGNSKFQFDNANINQHTLTFKGQNFELRSYLNSSKGGDSYLINGIAEKLNNLGTTRNLYTWYNDFLDAYFQGDQIGLQTFDIGVAKKFANERYNVLKPGTEDFNRTVRQIKSTPISKDGVLVKENSKVYHIEGNYNFSKHFDFVNFLVGGSYRRTKLDTQGSLFSDKDAPINIEEFGIYGQIRKKFLEDKLKLTASLRYDKSSNYNGTYSPRLTAGYTFGAHQNHNIRLAAQIAHRQPKSADQYLNVKLGVNSYALGNLQESLDEFQENALNVITFRDVALNGDFPFKPAFSGKSFNQFYREIISETNDNHNLEQTAAIATKNFNLLKTTTLKKGLKPEDVRSFEMGYRGMVNLSPTNILEFDVSLNYSNYKNFIVDKLVYIPLAGDPSAPRDNENFIEGDPFALAIFSMIGQNYVKFRVPQNTKTIIESYGASISMGTKIFGNYKLSGNYTWSDFSIDKMVDPEFESQFNTPKHTVKLLFGNENVFHNVGFNIAARWYDEHFFESEFADSLIPSRTTIDAQVSYKVPTMKSIFKLGGNNVFNKPYYDSVGSGEVGSIYYLSWIIND